MIMRKCWTSRCGRVQLHFRTPQGSRRHLATRFRAMYGIAVDVEASLTLGDFVVGDTSRDGVTRVDEMGANTC